MSTSAADADALRGRRWLVGPWPAALLGVLCFANTLRNGFVYDDIGIVVYNPRITTPGHLRDIWLSDWWQPREDGVGEQGTGNDEHPLRDRLYRPLTLFSFKLNYAALGRDSPPVRPEDLPAWSFHLVNLLLHAGVCALVWHLVRRLTHDPATAAVAATLFAVHPAHVEAVAGIVGRAELLAALFLLLGLVALMPMARPPGLGRGMAASAAFLAALLAKEHAICYPALALLALYARQRSYPLSRRAWLGRTALLLLPLVVYFPLRSVALEHQLLRPAPTSPLLNPLVEATPAQRAVGALTILGHYTRLLLLPAKLNSDYGLAVIHPHAGWTGMTVLGLAAAVGLAVGLTSFLRRGASWRRVAVLTAMTLASYALISNTVLLIGVAVGERLLYWPSVPVLVLVAMGVVPGGQRLTGSGGPLAASSRRLRVLAGLVVAVLGLRTVIRNADWASNIALAGRDVQAHPQSGQLNKGYALALMWLAEEIPDPVRQTEMLREAERHLTAALRIYPPYPDALALRARLRAHFGESDAARADAETALLLEPSHASALYVLSQLRGDPDATQAQLATLEAAVDERPDDAPAHLALGAALLSAGRPAAALDPLERAAALDPDNVSVRRLRAEALTASGRTDEAIAMHRRVLAADPNDWAAHANLAHLLVSRDGATALHHARRAYELDPTDLRSGLLLGDVLAARGLAAEARERYGDLLRGLDKYDPRRNVIQARLERLPPAGRR